MPCNAGNIPLQTEQQFQNAHTPLLGGQMRRQTETLQNYKKSYLYILIVAIKIDWWN